jgi:hypothetical protein
LGGACVHKIEMRHSVIYVFETGYFVGLGVKASRHQGIRASRLSRLFRHKR